MAADVKTIKNPAVCRASNLKHVPLEAGGGLGTAITFF